jgi:thiol-disulfide isomerase/thioredoxin
MKYYLFSAVHRCPPCRALVAMLEKSNLPWRDVVEYVDVDNATKEQNELATKLGVLKIPAFGTDESLLPVKFSMDIFNKIKELCITQE